jgi:hypothetical protein
VKDKLKTTKEYQTIGTQTDSNETHHNNIYHNGITYHQVRMLTLLQNRHQLLFWIKNQKISTHIYNLSYKISFFRLLEERKGIKKISV